MNSKIFFMYELFPFPNGTEKRVVIEVLAVITL